MTRYLRGACLGLCLLLGATAAPLGAQAPGSPESYMGYGKEYFESRSYGSAAVQFRQAAMLKPDNAEYQFYLGAALAGAKQWEEAREVLAKAVALDPSLKAQADEWLASAPSPAPRAGLPRPPAPTTPAAAPAPPAAPRDEPPAAVAAFKVGDAVEVEYRAGFWIPGVVTSADPGACPYYNVRADAYGNGNPSNLGYGCKTVRAPTGVRQPVAECGGSNPNCKPTSPPPLGTYLCHEQVWQGPGANPQYQSRYHGPLTLLSGGRYRYMEGGAIGQYRYDATSHGVSWTGGGMAGRGAVATYGLDVKTPEITVVFETETSRRTGNSGPKWQCALGR